MKLARVLLIAACCLCQPDSTAAQEAKDTKHAVAGYWEGVIKVAVLELRLGFHLHADDKERLSGKLDSIDQGAFGIPIKEIRFKDNKVEIDLPDLGASYAATLSKDGKSLEGTFKQAGMDLPLVLKKFDKAPDHARPQDPKKPYPYLEEEVEFENAKAKIKLAGTLTLPKDEGPHAAVVLISGSGPQDRNESLLNHRPFLVLADHLTRRGIAVLRFDDRGIGKSTGKFWDATSADFATDAEAAFQFLKTRKEIDPARIGLAGHSEGGLVAPLTAVENKEVAFIILLAGPGLPGSEIVESQLRVLPKLMGMSEKIIDWNINLQRTLVAVLKEETDDDKAAEKIKALADKAFKELEMLEPKLVKIVRGLAEAQLSPKMFKWSRFFMAHDPRPTLKKVTCPVLAINGETDRQVEARANLTEIGRALLEGGNKDMTLKEFAGLNHLFQRSKSGSPTEYGVIQTTIDPEVLEFVSGWIQPRFNKKK